MVKSKTYWKYRRCIICARQRDIPWELTYNQWRMIWVQSGHWHERGPYKGQYVMARFGDVGPYHKDNVRICTNTENQQEGHLGTNHSEATKMKMSKSQKGKQSGRKHRMYGKHHTDITTEKISNLV